MSNLDIRHIAIIICFIPLVSTAKGWSYFDIYQDEQHNDQPDFAFQQQTHNFGKLTSTQSHTFTYTNTGTAPLIILHIATGCGCTTTQYTKTPVQPGDTGKITVTYNPTSQRHGLFRKSVTVYFNSPKDYTHLFISGEVLK